MNAKHQLTEYGHLSSKLLCSKLSDLCVDKIGVQTGPFGSQLHKEDYVEIGTPIITVEHLGNNRISHIETPFVADEDKKRLSKYQLKNGDIVFSRVGSVDRRALVRKEEDGWLFSGRCLRVRVDETKIDPIYLSYFFGLESFKKYIRSIAVGATMPSINTKILSDIPIYYPECLEEQRRIAHILIINDEKENINNQTNQTLEEMAQAIFKSWFVDFDPVKAKMNGDQPEGMDADTASLFPEKLVESELGLIPDGWKIGTLNDIAKFQNGYAFKGKDWTDEGFPVVKIGSVKPGIVDLKSCSYVGKQTVDPLARFKLSVGDILVGMTGYVGETGLVPQSTVDPYLNQRVGRLTPLNQNFYELLYVTVRNAAYKQFAEAQAQGSAQANVSGKALMSYPIVIPSEEIVVKFSELIAPMIKQKLAFSAQSEMLAQTRDTLLPKLLSGEIELEQIEEMAEAI